MKALKVFASLAFAATAFGQVRDNQDKQLTCDTSGYGSGARYCEVREQATAAMGLLSIDPGQNGGATVKGWSRNEILVRFARRGTDRQRGRGANHGEPGLRQHLGRTCSGTRSTVLKQCGVVRELRDLRTAGNQSDGEDRQWGHYSVGHSWESALRSNQRGGNLGRLAGDVAGFTVNGGINLELMGTTWDGSQVQVTTLAEGRSWRKH
jgi:hypothetical protein